MNEAIKKELQAAACKVCTSGCIASFDCGKTKSDFGAIPLFGANTVCPLEKFNVDHDKEKTDRAGRLGLDDLYLLCKYCEHRDSSNDTEHSISTARCFESHCMDCPVQSCRENMQEGLAEGAMS